MYRSKTQAVRRKKMTTEQKLERAMSLVSRAGDFFSDDPPEDWFRDYYILTGEHMVATEEGWQLGSNKAELIAEYGEDYIQDEVNAPVRK
jgi:hypothetical protein